MKRYDLLVHTKHHRTSINEPRLILKRAKQLGLNGVAVVDRSLKGALEVKGLNKDKDFEVIVWQEVKVQDKKLLCYYVKKPVKGRTVKEVVTEVHKQKGFVAFRGKTSKVDAVLSYSSKSLLSISNSRLKKVKNAKIGGSDADFLFEIGEGLTLFEGDLIKAIKNKKTIATGTCINAPFSWIGRFFVWLSSR